MVKECDYNDQNQASVQCFLSAYLDWAGVCCLACRVYRWNYPDTSWFYNLGSALLQSFALLLKHNLCKHMTAVPGNPAAVYSDQSY